MKRKIPLAFIGLFSISSAVAQSLYYGGSEATESLPLKWLVGASLIFDDNVNPGYGDEDSSLGFNPYVGVSFVNITPQTTLDVYARLGLIYYFDAPKGMDELSSQSRAGVNYTHRFTERLRFVSRNFISYELEPDYSYGYATSRITGEYFHWQTDNSVGFRWTERVATYTGLRLTGTDYDSSAPNNDRFTWELYNQFRYQLTPQTVLTGEYRYGETSGNGYASDSTNQYLLVGAEHRFSPNMIGIIRAGAQFRDVDGGDNSTSPYVELAFNAQLSEALRLRSFARYGIEDYDTVQLLPGGPVEYSERRTLRFGLAGEYALSPSLSLLGGIDYIPSDFRSGRYVDGPNEGSSASGFDEEIFNAYIGVSVRFNDFLTGMASYNFTDSSSDDKRRDYTRNRISVGVSAEF
jgi:hypothetical protein